MRFKNIEIDFNDNDWAMWDDDANISLFIKSNNELINMANDLRVKLGCDIPSEDNDIYYDFYLCCDLAAKTIRLEAVVKNCEDGFNYYLFTVEKDEEEFLCNFVEDALIENYDWYKCFIGSAYETVEYCIDEANCNRGDIAYEIGFNECRFVNPLKIVKCIKRSDCKFLYDLADKDALVIGESKFKADCSAEFITDKDSYLVWFRGM